MMHANIVCPECGHTWQPAAQESACPHCQARLAVEWHITAEPDTPQVAPGAISKGEPPFVLPVDEDDEDPRWRRSIRRTPEGWVALSITIALVALSAGVDALHASAEIEKGRAILDMPGGANAIERFGRAQSFTNFLGLIEVLLLVASTIAAYTWIRIVYRNLRVLRVSGLQHPPPWGIVRWILPLGLFFLPPRVLQEIWRASDPNAPIDSDAWKTSPGAWLIWLWWPLFLLRHVRISINIQPFPANDPILLDVLMVAAWITAAACLCGIAAALAFCVLALRLERRQWRRFDRLQDV